MKFPRKSLAPYKKHLTNIKSQITQKVVIEIDQKGRGKYFNMKLVKMWFSNGILNFMNLTWRIFENYGKNSYSVLELQIHIGILKGNFESYEDNIFRILYKFWFGNFVSAVSEIDKYLLIMCNCTFYS